MKRKTKLYTYSGNNCYRLKSFTEMGVEYDIDFNALSCTCPAWANNLTRPCKHIIWLSKEVKFKMPKPKSGDDLTDTLNEGTILDIKKYLNNRNREDKLSVKDLEKILKIEEKGNNRSGITEWIKHSIEVGELIGEYLDYQGKVSIYKSALQKYIRRGIVDRALMAGRCFYTLANHSAIRRLKIIIGEDVFTAVELIGKLNDDIDIDTFLSIVKVAAESPKDKSCSPLGDFLKDDKSIETYHPTHTEVAWAKAHIQNGKELPKLTTIIYKLCVENRLGEIYEILGQSDVVKACISRANEGTFIAGDYWVLIISAIRYVQGDYLLKNIKLPKVNVETIPWLKLSEIEWWCLDFHTPIGRLAMRFYLSKHREIEELRFRRAWFKCESAQLGGAINKEWLKQAEKYKWWNQDKVLWEKMKPEIIKMVEWIAKDKFKLGLIDKVYTEKKEGRTD